MHSLGALLKSGKFPKQSESDKRYQAELDELQLKMLRIQQGIFHSKKRAIILFEGFDAAGKGGAIRRLTEKIDPRGVHVHPIGPPTEEERQFPYLQRFWQRLPKVGRIAIFDRSWYGRVLVERVEKLAPQKRLEAAYREINEFEELLIDEDIDLVKIFIGISKDEQGRRFEARLADPYKRWKISEEDLKARAKWKDYVKATDRMMKKTGSKAAPWHLVAGDDKDYARAEVLRIVTRQLKSHRKWMESHVDHEKAELKKALAKDL
jgi:polyphosphate kinase 2 (PPK2 family)